MQMQMKNPATSKKLTDEEISTFVEANPTAIIYYVAKTSDMCENPTDVYKRQAHWRAGIMRILIRIIWVF